jgi:hypothetical protein
MHSREQDEFPAEKKHNSNQEEEWVQLMKAIVVATSSIRLCEGKNRQNGR